MMLLVSCMSRHSQEGLRVEPWEVRQCPRTVSSVINFPIILKWLLKSENTTGSGEFALKLLTGVDVLIGVCNSSARMVAGGAFGSSRTTWSMG